MTVLLPKHRRQNQDETQKSTISFHQWWYRHQPVDVFLSQVVLLTVSPPLMLCLLILKRTNQSLRAIFESFQNLYFLWDWPLILPLMLRIEAAILDQWSLPSAPTSFSPTLYWFHKFYYVFRLAIKGKDVNLSIQHVVKHVEEET